MGSTRLYAIMDVELAVEGEDSVGSEGRGVVDEEARVDIVAVGGSIVIAVIAVIVESEATVANEATVERADTVAADVAGEVIADVVVGEARKELEEISLSHKGWFDGTICCCLDSTRSICFPLPTPRP
jgi:hypothetical protein